MKNRKNTCYNSSSILVAKISCQSKSQFFYSHLIDLRFFIRQTKDVKSEGRDTKTLKRTWLPDFFVGPTNQSVSSDDLQINTRTESIFFFEMVNFFSSFHKFSHSYAFAVQPASKN